MRKGNLLLIFLLSAAFLLPVAVRAQFTFTTNNGTITITGYTGSDSSVVIPDMTNGLPVTCIGVSAFYGLSSVTNVTIPNSVTNIDAQAFLDCGLVGITIPDSVISVGTAAFEDCFSLTNLVIGNGVITLGDDAFSNCSGLLNVFIPKGITNILYDTAFNGCSSLTNITVDTQNPAYSSLGGVLFDKNQTVLVTYPDGMGPNYAIPPGVRSIGDFAFTFSQILSNLTALGSSITNIGQYAFYGCSGLTNVSIPEGVTTIGQYAFAACSGLTNIFIPESVTNIGIVAFSGIPAMTVAANNPAYSSVAGVLFNSNETTLVEFPSRQLGFLRLSSFTIPGSVTCIGDAAFEDCGFLTNIVIPPSVTSIGNLAFNDCAQLINLNIPDSVTNIGDEAFDATSLESITVPASVTTFGWISDWPNLRSMYFLGDAPGQGNGIRPVWFLENVMKAYYLPGTTGWGEYFQENIPTVLWLPQMQTSGGGFGVQSNQFGFNINWASGQTVVVEACTNLANPDWQPVQTNTLTSGSVRFSDPQWTNYPCRFYRIRSL